MAAANQWRRQQSLMKISSAAGGNNLIAQYSIARQARKASMAWAAK